MEISKQLLANLLPHLCFHSLIDTDYMYLPKFCMNVSFSHTQSICVKVEVIKVEKT